jgi:rod shape-determining protein MreB
VPSDARASERRALLSAVRAAGATEVALLSEPVAAAVGAGTELGTGFAQLILDVGEGVTDASVVDQRGIIASAAIRIGCADLRAAVRRAFVATDGTPIDEHQAERLLRACGVAGGAPGDGRTRSTASAGELSVDAADVHAALRRETAAIAACVAALLRRLADEHACQVIESGIVLTGGGALLPGMCAVLEDATQVAVRVAHDPLHAVISGASLVLRQAVGAGLWTASGDERALGARSTI